MSDIPESDRFPESARQFHREHRQWLAEMHRPALEMLAMNLLHKRDCDGLNGRHWDAFRHLYFEKLIESELRRKQHVA